ncbi:MAG: hypothetical protein UR66_C0012G0025 [Candidatus Moranbacteria bacterium GW2011_GWE1_35_17]|nr:MAG: hypothetical protein UR66_C0012G0025 [Candidatus Moranbacteria bacterium GW2011_GWE1_35_17]KKP82027.1 MAG: hypothetical protein UR82_C0045G0011 [Candidatus Moranbacteria bacterium GW2011_GWF1_35_5]KKP82730.1 MAG: hypothetical protein UR83_C0047G0009 [Candidatus Moranbacteria bacterium GW2011_GWF2_35_54]
MPYCFHVSHQLVPSILSPKEYRRINKASVELELPLQLTSPVVAPTCHAVLVIERPREFRSVKSASVVLVTEELSTSGWMTKAEGFSDLGSDLGSKSPFEFGLLEPKSYSNQYSSISFLSLKYSPVLSIKSAYSFSSLN